MPWLEFWNERTPEQRVRSLSATGWTNVYSYFSEANIWPVVSLGCNSSALPNFDTLPEVESDCPIQQGLADGILM